MSAAPERTREERFLSWTGREGRKLWDALPTILPVAAGLLFTVSTARSEKFPGGWFFWSGVIIIESVTPWTDESLQNSIQEREGDFAALRDTAAEIIYIVRNSFNDVAAGRPNIH